MGMKMRENRPARDTLVITLSFLVALVLTLLPLPVWAVWLRPQWVFMTLIFWAMYFPYRVGLGSAFAVGLVMDLATGTLLGQHALVYVLLLYLLHKFHSQPEIFPFWQQMLIVFALLAGNLSMQYGIFSLLDMTPHYAFWWSLLTSTLLWPWISLLLREKLAVPR